MFDLLLVVQLFLVAVDSMGGDSFLGLDVLLDCDPTGLPPVLLPAVYVFGFDLLLLLDLGFLASDLGCLRLASLFLEP